MREQLAERDGVALPAELGTAMGVDAFEHRQIVQFGQAVMDGFIEVQDAASTSCMAAVVVMALVMEAIAKIVSRVAEPYAQEEITLSALATAATAAGIWWRQAASANTSEKVVGSIWPKDRMLFAAAIRIILFCYAKRPLRDWPFGACRLRGIRANVSIGNDGRPACQ